MAHTHAADERIVYQITVRGHLDDRWSDWFSGLAVAARHDDDGQPVTTLTGLVDQAALRGILNRCWDLNLSVVSVTAASGDLLDGGTS
jgi:hypothetical protein